MKILLDVKPKAKTIIQKIEGGEETKKHLKDLGIMEGIKLTVLEQAPQHEQMGAITLSVDDTEVVLGYEMAEKLYVDKEGSMTSFLELEKNDRGIVKAFGGGKDFAGWFSSLGIEKGKEIGFPLHLPDDTLFFEIKDKPVVMGDGQASKILVDYKGKKIQINYLRTGEKAKIASIIGGTTLKKKFKQEGIRKGTEITMSKREPTSPSPDRGKYVCAEINGRQITINYGIAKKVWVNC